MYTPRTRKNDPTSTPKSATQKKTAMLLNTQHWTFRKERIDKNLKRYTNGHAHTAVTWTSPTIVDIVPHIPVPTTAIAGVPAVPAVPTVPSVPAVPAVPAARPKRAFPFCPFEFKPVKCAKWHEQLVPLPPPTWFTDTLPVPPASLLPVLTKAEASLWHAEPFNFDIDTEWLLFEAEKRLG